MCYIELSKGRYYKGFDSCIKIEQIGVTAIEIIDNIEYTYFLEHCTFDEAKAFLRGSLSLSSEVFSHKVIDIHATKHSSL